MNTLKEVPHPDAIAHAIEVLRSYFDHPEADEAIAGLMLLREQAKWAHHTPALLSDADAAADLAGLPRPGAEPVARLLSWIGKGTYPKNGYTVARTWEELPKDSYPKDWQEGAPLYTAPTQASQPNRFRFPFRECEDSQSEQPEQEPEYVQLRHKEEYGFSPWGSPLDPKHRHDRWAAGVEMRLLYTAPPQASQPLTQQEKQRLWNDAMYDNRSSTTDAAMDYGSAIEAAHSIGAAQKGKP